MKLPFEYGISNGHMISFGHQMTIQQFIEKHSLSLVQVGDLKPAVLLMGDRDDPRRFEERYEFYRNADRTIWVSINRTQNWFRIVRPIDGLQRLRES